MPIARFQLPDGRVARFEVPEGTTPEQAQSLMAEAMGPAPGAEPAKFVDGKAQIPGLAPGQEAMVPANPNPPPPEALANEGFLTKLVGAVQAARATVNGILGGSIGAAGGLVEGLVKAGVSGTLGTPAGANAVEQTAAARAAQLGKPATPMNAAAQRYMHGIVEPVGQALQPLAGHMNLHKEFPGSAEAAGGLIQRVGDEARVAGAATKDAGLNAAAGMVKLNPQKLENAGAAVDAGLDVPLHAIGDRGPLVKTAGETMGHLPLSGSKVDKNVRAFNRKVIEQINPDEASAQLTPKVVDNALKSAGKTIGENMRAVSVPMDDLSPHIGAIRSGLETATTDARNVVGGYLGQIEAKAAENGGVIPGAALRELDTKLGEQLRSFAGKHPDIENRLADLQEAIRDTAASRMTPEQAAATQTARQRYAKTMSLIPAYEDIRNEGYLPPGKLMDLVARSPLSKRLMATGRGGEWQDLAAAGELVAPKSGATRARVVGGTVTAGGGGLYLGTSGAASPAGLAGGAAAVLGAANLYNRAGPKVVRALVKRERARNAPPEPPPEAPLTTTPGAGGESGPRGGTVLPPPQDGPLGPAGPDLTTSPGAGGIELPSELSPAEARLAGRLTPFDDQPLTEKPPRRIIKSGERPDEVERRGLRAVPPAEGRPDLPPEMVAGGLADRPGQTSEVAGNTTSGVTGAGKGVRATEGNPEAMRSEGAALGRRKIIEDRYAAAGGQAEPGNHPAPKPPAAPAAEPAPAPADPRLAEIEALRAKADSPAVLAALKKREAAVRRTMAEEDAARQREADAAALDDAARKAQDPETKALLKAEADKLREPIPVGETKEGFPPAPAEPRGKIPVGKTREVPLPAAGRDGELQAPMPLPEVEELPVQRVEGGEPIPRGEATEVEPVPVGQADEMLPVGQADEMVPTGEASEMLPTGEATEGPPPMVPAPKPRIIAPPGAPPGQPPMPPAPKPPPKGPPPAPAPAVKTYRGVDTRVIGGEAGQAREAAEAADRAAKTAANAKLSLGERRANAVLDKGGRLHEGGRGVSLRESIDRRIAEGATVQTKEGQRALVNPSGSYVLERQFGKIGLDYAVAQLEKRNAPQEKPQPAGVQGEPQGRDEGRAPAEAGPGDRVQRAAEGEGQATEVARPDIDRAWRDLTGQRKFSDHDRPAMSEVTDHGGNDFVLSRAKGDAWVSLSVREVPEGGAVSSSLEQMDYPKGTGAATTMYLEALNIAKKRGLGWTSESIRSGESHATYKRLKDAGVPFSEENGASVLSAEDLKNTDLNAVAERLLARTRAAANEAVVPEATNRQNAPKKRLIAPRNPESKPVENIVYETPDFNVRYVGKKGYEVYETGATASTKVAAVGNGKGPNLGLERAKAEADRRQALRSAPKPAPAPAKPTPKPMIQSMKPSERLAELNRQIDERMADAKAADDADVLELAREQQAKPDEKMLKAKYPYEKLRDQARATIQASIDDRRNKSARSIGHVTIKAGGTTYTVVNTQERLQALKAQIAKDPGFKDKPTRPVTPRGTEDPATAKRHPKTVVQDFVADGDFENAQALADHYGIDIKAGMDAKQKQAYQDWRDSKAP